MRISYQQKHNTEDIAAVNHADLASKIAEMNLKKKVESRRGRISKTLFFFVDGVNVVDASHSCGMEPLLGMMVIADSSFGAGDSDSDTGRPRAPN